MGKFKENGFNISVIKAQIPTNKAPMFKLAIEENSERGQQTIKAKLKLLEPTKSICFFDTP